MNVKFFGILILTIACLGVASAAVTCPNTGLATTYVNSDGSLVGGVPPGYVCDIGNLEFSNFTYAYAPNPGGVAPGDISVSRLGGTETGLKFAGGWIVGGVNPNANEDSDISFTVTALNGTSIDDLTIDITSPQVTGNGIVHYTETFCMTGGNTCSTFVEDTTSSTSSFTSHILLANTPLGGPVTSLTITKDIQLHANGGTASVSSFDNTYSTSGVPEPRAISLLLGIGLIGGLALLKRRQTVTSVQ